MRPVDDEQQLAHIEKLQWEQLNDEFKEQCQELISDLKSKAQAKSLTHKDIKTYLNPQMLLGLAMDFCEAVNSADAPKIETSVGRVLQEETQVISDDCYFELQSMLEEKIGLDPLPKDKVEEIIKSSS